MNFQAADNLSLILFSLFSLFMLGLIVYAFQKAQVAKKYYGVFAVYLFGLSALVISGVVSAHIIPAVPMLFVISMLLAISFACCSVGYQIAHHFSLAALVGFQSFRLPLELVLHRWAQTGTIPETMTWTGQNFDIITGVSSLVLFSLVNRHRVFAWIFQIVGFGLLLNVLRVVIMSSPFPFSWPLENPLLLALYFPYVLIVPLFVAPALFGHIVLFRKLRF